MSNKPINKFRTFEQRQLIQQETLDGLEQLQVLDSVKTEPLRNDLNLFLKDTSGRKFDGSLDMGDYEIIYCLPGRRMLRHFVHTKTK